MFDSYCNNFKEYYNNLYKPACQVSLMELQTESKILEKGSASIKSSQRKNFACSVNDINYYIEGLLQL